MKKILALLLCAVMIFASALPAFASEFDDLAFIAVSGMNTFPLYDSDNNKVYPFSTSKILDMAKDILPAVMNYLVTKDSDRLCDKVLPVLTDAFDIIACNEDGNSKYDLHTDIFTGYLGEKAAYFNDFDTDEEGIVRAAIEKFGESRTFFFNYDWRLDPLDHADELNKFIKEVKELTGCKRVSLASFSMGGNVTLAYLQKYGSGDVDCIELCSTAFQGTDAVGELFKGDLVLDIEGLIDRLASLTRRDAIQEFLEYLNDGLAANGFDAKISDFANEILTGQKERIYTEFLIPVFGYMPGLWALANYEDFEADKAFMLKGGAGETLNTRIDFYHNSVQGKAETLLKRALYDTNVYIISQYNLRGICCSDGTTYENDDLLIETKYSSGGATVARLYETLGDDYTQQYLTELNYLSADGIIDASTCMLPDKTWFIKDMAHIDFPYGGDGAQMVLYFASQEQQLTVWNAPYPQFQEYDYQSKTLSPVSGEKKTTFLTGILAFFSKIRNAFYSLINKIFSI